MSHQLEVRMIRSMVASAIVALTAIRVLSLSTTSKLKKSTGTVSVGHIEEKITKNDMALAKDVAFSLKRAPLRWKSVQSLAFTSGEIVEVGELQCQSYTLLLRLERNVKDVRAVKRVFVYSHGFPDSSVTPEAISEAKRLAAGGERQKTPLFFASRMPRKLCEMVMRKAGPNNAFVCFNSRGIPGSGGEFHEKTLTDDLDDLHDTVVAIRQHYPNASDVVLCGLSTGAFLTLAYLDSTRSSSCSILPTCAIVFACVDDIPTSKVLDFTPKQISDMNKKGFCTTDFYPVGCNGVPERKRLDVGYLRSYDKFWGATTMAQRIKTPVLLIHGTADKHVPYSHAKRLLKCLQSHSSLGSKGFDLITVEGGNHFLSSKKHFKLAEREILRWLSALMSGYS